MSTVHHLASILYMHGGGIDAPLSLDRNGYVIVPHANYRGFYDGGTDTTAAAVTATVNWLGREQDPFMDSQQPDSVKGWSGTLLKASQDQSGLMYRRNRYYDPSTGHFTQTDRTGLRGGVNLYGYAAGDPVNRWDPFGLAPMSQETMGRLWGVCMLVNCDKIDVTYGDCFNDRASARGYSICIPSGQRCDLETLAHEAYHVTQYARLGSVEYFAHAAHDQAMYEWWKFSGWGYNPYTDDRGWIEYDASMYAQQFHDQDTPGQTGC